MTPGVHRVRRQSWHVRMRSAQDAFAARTRLRLAVEHELREAFDRAFDLAAPDEAVVHIPRLELRLRVASLDGLADALAEAIDRELRLHPPPPPRASTPDWLEMLFEYLETGSVAWHAAHAEAAVISSALRATLLEKLEAVVRRGQAGIASFEQTVQFYFRLLKLLPEEQWPQLAALVSSASPETLDAPAATLLIANALRQGFPVMTATAAEKLWPLQRSPRAALTALAALRTSLQHQTHRLAALVLAAARMPALARDVRPLAAAKMNPAENPAARAAPEPKAEPFDVRYSRDEVGTQVLPARGSRTLDAPQTFALMAGNAGLVLMHPFLPRLFDACGLLHEEGELREPERAAALLHWLATGREELYEFELGFVKLLLGLRPEMPLAVGKGLPGAHEREEGEALLAAVIGHWKALGNTSLDGLRVSFLQRRGALREEEMGWRLQLEPESFDVLLGHLPWGFATVKLQWMTRPLFTDWPTP